MVIAPLDGGELAERKTAGLLAAGAAVTVLSPDVTETIADWLSQKAITVIPRYYQPGDLAEFDLVFVATDDSQVNAVAYREGRSYGIWVNSADDPARCDFILPSVQGEHRGDDDGIAPCPECPGGLREDGAPPPRARREAEAQLRPRRFRYAAPETTAPAPRR